jgi:hypothetical protein
MGVKFNFVEKKKKLLGFAKCLHKVLLTQHTQTIIAGASRPDQQRTHASKDT